MFDWRKDLADLEFERNGKAVRNLIPEFAKTESGFVKFAVFTNMKLTKADEANKLLGNHGWLYLGPEFFYEKEA